MRSIFTVVIALALASVAQAQDETESPAASAEEHPSSSLSAPSSLREAPAATPEQKPSASVEMPKAEASPTASATPEKQKSATAQDTDASAAPASASAGPDKGKPESVVKRLENEWEAAVMKHDASFIGSRVAKDFVGVSSHGKRSSKSGLMKEFKGDTDTYTSAKNGSLTVRAFGKDVVVASGTAREVGKTRDGAAFNRSYIFTDTWMLRGERWECIASQVMLEPAKK